MPGLSIQTQVLLRTAIASGAQPFAPRGQQKLVVRAPGGKRAISLFTRDGRLNPAGELFFRERAETAPDRTFDPTQRPVIVGRREQILLRDGAMGTTRTFYADKWKPTKLGLQFYKDAKRNYIVFFPVDRKYVKDMADGRVLTTWGRNERIESTATDLGAISLPGTMDSQEAMAEVKRRVQDWVARQPREEGHVVVARDYYVDTLLREDWLEHLDIREEDVGVTQDGELGVEAMERRPLRSGRPWLMHNSYQWAVSDEAYVETDGQCVVTQMLARSDIWTHQELMEDFALAYEHLYHEENPYMTEDGLLDWHTAGVNIAMVKWVCLKWGVPIHTLWRGQLVSKQGEGPGLAILVDGDHAYFVKDPKMLDLVAKTPIAPMNKPAHVVACDKKAKRDPESSWKPLDWDPCADQFNLLGQMEPGRTYTVTEQDMEELRSQLLGLRVSPGVRMCTATKIASLLVPLRGQKEPARVVGLPHNSDQLRRMAKAVEAHIGRPFEYQGETQEILSERALLELMAPGPRPKIRQKDHMCAKCTDALERRIGDHIVARSQGGTDDPSNIQDICPGCSDEKTVEEALSSVQGSNPLMSRLNRETYRLFHQSPKPPQMVATMHQPDPRRGVTLEVDVRRCRFRAMVEALEIPVYATTDEIKPARLELECYNWVSGCRLTDPLRALPFFGPAWYTRADCQFMLSHGIIVWHHIEFGFRPSALLDRKLPEALMSLDAIFTTVSEQAAKSALNAMIGRWGKPTRYRYNLETTTNPEEVLFEGPRQIRPTLGGEGLQDVITTTRVLTYGSMRPIQQLALSNERLVMARLSHFVRTSCEPRALICYNVDALYVQPGKRKVDKLKSGLERVRYRDLPNLGDPWARGTGGSDELVFRVRERRPDLKQCELSIRDAPAPELETLEWRTVVEPEGGPDDFYSSIREQVVDRGQSCLVVGPPGFGKSWILKQLKRELEAQGETVRAIAPYHVATRQLQCDATTTHSFVHRHVLGGTFKGVLLLDEVFVVSPEIVSLLEHCTLSGTRIVCFGDPDQLRSIQPQWRGQSVPSGFLEESNVLKRWCDGRIFKLGRYRRGEANREFADTFIMIRQLEGVSAIREVCERFPCTRGAADWNLVISHHERKRINTAYQEKLAMKARESGLERFRVEGEEAGYWVFEGTKLIGCNNKHKKIKNGALLEVVGVGSTIRLRDIESMEVIKVPLEQLSRFTRLRHAITISACQGRTLPGLVRLWSLGSKHMTSAHIYVACSRAEGPSKFEVVPPSLI